MEILPFRISPLRRSHGRENAWVRRRDRSSGRGGGSPASSAGRRAYLFFFSSLRTTSMAWITFLSPLALQ